MAIGISPLVDFAFKLMLGSPEHSGVTIHFLNSILTDQPRITHVEILNPFLGKESEDDKLSILDILATDEHGRLLNIEMQTSLPAGMSQRLAYYVSCLYVGQLYEGSQYSELRPAISICVLTQAMWSESRELHLDFRLRESVSTQILTDDLQIHLLQLSNLRVKAENVYYASPAERWSYFLQNADRLTPAEIRRLFPDEEITEAAGVLEMISQTPEQLMLYNARLKFQRDEEARIIQARMEGEARGRQEGEARGRLLGRITVLQELLGVGLSTVEELAGYNDGQLHDMAEELQNQLRSR
ncbi:MAG: Rpn family recombination-promoting nuclease/putative transposase [Planctomycetaceae bacterium]